MIEFRRMRRRFVLDDCYTEKSRNDESALLVSEIIQLFLERLIRTRDLLGTQRDQADFVALLMGFDIVMMDTRTPIIVVG